MSRLDVSSFDCTSGSMLLVLVIMYSREFKFYQCEFPPATEHEIKYVKLINV